MGLGCSLDWGRIIQILVCLILFLLGQTGRGQLPSSAEPGLNERSLSEREKMKSFFQPGKRAPCACVCREEDSIRDCGCG